LQTIGNNYARASIRTSAMYRECPRLRLQLDDTNTGIRDREAYWFGDSKLRTISIR
jgi:hypothetical protein